MYSNIYNPQIGGAASKAADGEISDADGWDDLRSTFLDKLTDQDKLRGFIENFSKFYLQKRNKYAKLAETAQSNLDQKFDNVAKNGQICSDTYMRGLKDTPVMRKTIDAKNDPTGEARNEAGFATFVQKANGELVDAWVNEWMKGQSDVILNGNLSSIKYVSLKDLIDKKISSLNTDNPANLQKFKENMLEFLDYCDNLSTKVESKIRHRCVTYLVELASRTIDGECENNFGPFNYILKGQPGVGKSHTAKIISELLKKSQLLAKGDLKNIKKPDIIGQYIGTTAPLLYDKYSDALECVIFIDEAYSIAGPKRADMQQHDPFGEEAIGAIVDFSSEHGCLFAQIAAGYPAEMESQFLEVNTGLRRRFEGGVYTLNRAGFQDVLKIANSVTGRLFKTLIESDNTPKTVSPVMLRETVKTIFKHQQIHLFSLFLWLFNFTSTEILYNEITSLRSKPDIWLYDKGAIAITTDVSHPPSDSSTTYVDGLYSIGARRPRDMFKESIESSLSDFPITSPDIISDITNLFIKFDIKQTNGTVKTAFFNILKYGSYSEELDSRKPFGYNVNDLGIQWFFLSFLLEKVSGIKDGDMFKQQASAFMGISRIMVTKYGTEDEQNYEQFFQPDDRQHNKLLQYLSQMIKRYSTQTELDLLTKVGISRVGNSIIIHDKLKWFSNIFNQHCTPISAQSINGFMLVLYNKMLVEFDLLSILKKEKMHRRFTQFSIQDIHYMQSTRGTFEKYLNEDNLLNTLFIEDLDHRHLGIQGYMDIAYICGKYDKTSIGWVFSDVTPEERRDAHEHSFTAVATKSLLNLGIRGIWTDDISFWEKKRPGEFCTIRLGDSTFYGEFLKCVANEAPNDKCGIVYIDPAATNAMRRVVSKENLEPFYISRIKKFQEFLASLHAELAELELVGILPINRGPTGIHGLMCIDNVGAEGGRNFTDTVTRILNDDVRTEYKGGFVYFKRSTST
uniref:ATPase AAA-type core domain-containing protein n=1 Tax=viral metagenome TaxID=1070528 RepID=A0A6C0B3S9_9ZZZZ